MTDISKVQRYYDGFSEWERLDTPAGKLEFLLSMRHLDEYLPAESRVLDLGGGPGRYSIELAKRGHRVFLAELSPSLLEVAEEKIHGAGVSERILGTEKVNALDLGRFAAETFDAVISFGPFYHLTSETERRQAAGEAHRVLKADGLLFAAFMPWLSGISHLIWRAAHGHGQVTARSFTEAYETGIFANQSDNGLQEAYFAKPDEISELFESVGFASMDMIAVQGIAIDREGELFRLKDADPLLFKEVFSCIVESSRRNSVIETGGHCIYTGRKAQPSAVGNGCSATLHTHAQAPRSAKE